MKKVNLDGLEKLKIFNSIENMPCVGKKAKWAYKWIENKEVNFATRLLAFSISRLSAYDKRSDGFLVFNSFNFVLNHSIF